MKLIKKIILPIFALLTFALSANAQGYLEDEKYGATPEERKENATMLNYFMDAYKSERFDDALGYLRTLMQKAPRSSQNLYIYGLNIYKEKIKKSNDPKEKELLIDTLLNIYDKRAEFFGDHPKTGRAYILDKKAHDYYVFRPNNIQELHKQFIEAIEAGGGNVSIELMTDFLNIVSEEYMMDQIETDVILNEYERMSGILDKKEQSPEVENARKVLDAILVRSGAANCENLEKIFKPRFVANPNDTELMKKIVGLLARNNCNSDFQLEVAEAYYKVNPNASTAASLANAFEQKKDFEKAIKYLKEAVQSETDVTAKSNYLIRIALSSLSANDYRSAASYAREAASVNPANGYAYMIQAQAYAGGSSSACGDQFSRQASFWLVVDILVKARGLLSSDAAQLESVNKQIATYSSYFPNSEEIFFRDLSAGSSYTVNCGWISGTTTVRTR